jgi:hypothetical protein
MFNNTRLGHCRLLHRCYLDVLGLSFSTHSRILFSSEYFHYKIFTSCDLVRNCYMYFRLGLVRFEVGNSSGGFSPFPFFIFPFLFLSFPSLSVPVPSHVPYGLHGLSSRLWQKCNRLMWLGRPSGAVMLSP